MSAGLIEGFLVLAVLVIVPLGMTLHPALGPRWLRPAFAAALPAAIALTLKPSPVAALLSVPWLVLAIGASGSSALLWWRGSHTLISLLPAAAAAYLVVGAGWLVLNRLAVEPAGIVEPFVLLTAVHFHYAGFTATVLAGLVYRRTVEVVRRPAGFMALAVAGSTPIVGAGFTVSGVLQIVGAVLLAFGLFALSWLTLRHVVGQAPDSVARVLLIVSSLAVVVPMVLAVQWALGWNLGTPALSIPAMARTHGVANGLGFALCGVLGWRRLVQVAA